MECYSALERKGVLTHVTRWMNIDRQMHPPFTFTLYPDPLFRMSVHLYSKMILSEENTDYFRYILFYLFELERA